MVETRHTVRDVLKENIFTLLGAAVCFILLMSQHSTFGYSDICLSALLEQINSIILVLISILFGLRFISLRLPELLYVVFAAVLCLLMSIGRLYLFPLFPATAGVGLLEVNALLHSIEIGILSLSCFLVVYVQGRMRTMIDDLVRAIVWSIGIMGCILFCIFLVVYALPIVFQDQEAKARLYNSLTWWCLFMQLATCFCAAYVTIKVLAKKTAELLWSSVSSILLMGGIFFLYLSANEKHFLYDALVCQTTALIAMLTGGINELRSIYEKKVTYSRTLEKAIAEKAQEAARRSETVEALREKAIETQETSRIKSELLANMSHELRTPMNSIIGFTSRAIKKTEGIIPEQQLKNLKTVQRNAYHLLSLINTILDVSKLEAGRMEIAIDDFELGGLIDEVMDMSESLLQGKEVRLAKDAPERMVIKSDRTKVKQIIVNLIGNAIKFTEKGEIKIAAHKIAPKEDAVEEGISIKISDTGCGIPKEALPYIFDDYKQVDGSLTRKTGGTGLGLALVKRFTHLLGGAVGVESEYQRGTTFKIELPLEPKERVDVEEEQKQKARDTRTLLCLESPSGYAAAGESYFAKKQYDVVIVGDTESAFRAAKEQYPRLVTIDILSPQQRAFDLLKKCKENYYTRDIHFCAMGFFNDARYGYFLKIFGIVNKPVTKEFGKRLIAVAEQHKHLVQSILYVDHDIAAKKLLEESFISDASRAIYFASNEEEVKDRMKRKQPNVVALNIMLPGLEAFRIVSMLGTHKNWCDIPIVFVASDMLVRNIQAFYNTTEIFYPPKGDLKQADVLKKVHAFAEESA